MTALRSILQLPDVIGVLFESFWHVFCFAKIPRRALGAQGFVNYTGGPVYFWPVFRVGRRRPSMYEGTYVMRTPPALFLKIWANLSLVPCMHRTESCQLMLIEVCVASVALRSEWQIVWSFSGINFFWGSQLGEPLLSYAPCHWNICSWLSIWSDVVTTEALWLAG